MRRERRQDGREREVPAGAHGLPVVHVRVHRHAVRDVDEPEPPGRRGRRPRQRRERRHHRIQQRQGHRRAQSPQHRPPRERLLRDDHGRAPSPERRAWNGRLLTMLVSRAIEAVALGGGGPHDPADGGRVGMGQAPPQRIGQQLFGHGREKHVGAPQAAPPAARRRRRRASRPASRRRRRSASTLRSACASGRPRRSSRGRGRADPSWRGSSRKAGLARCWTMRSRHRQHVALGVVVLQIGHVRRWGAAGACRAGSPGSTCPGARATCGGSTRWRPEPPPCRAAPAGGRRGASPGGSGSP